MLISTGQAKDSWNDDPELERAIRESYETVPGDMPWPDDDIEIFQAIADSLKESKTPYTSFEPESPLERKREDGMPVGLKNIGNTCYFNSLMQAYFMIPKLVQEILSFKPHPSHLKQKQVEGVEIIRKKASIKLVEAIQRLFAFLIRSNRKYADPSNVLNALVDDFGNHIEIGDQKDVGEFNMIFVARVEEGLKAKYPAEETKETEADGKKVDVPVFLRKQTLNLSSKELTISSIVSNLFYGNLAEFLYATEADGTPVVAKKSSVFGQILLDVEEGDLFSAWDASYHAQIEGYKTPLNHVCVAEQEAWLEKAPSMLLFQIQRVKYDSETFEIYKDNRVFNYPKTLYPDRFLLENKELGTNLRKRFLEIKKKIKILENTLQKFRNYKALYLDLPTMMNNAASFFDDHENPQSQESKIQGITTYSPDRIVPIPEGSLEMERAKNLVKNLSGLINEKIEIMETELAMCKQELQDIFEIPKLTKNPYNLHSIMIHSGQANSGHYYSYVFDAEYQKWRRYSDIYISDMAEADVCSDALGGYGHSSAYCLMYIRESLIPKIPKGLQRSYTLTSSVEQVSDHYKTLLSPELRAEVDKDNQKFDLEIEEFRISEILKNINELYTVCLNQAWTQKFSYFGTTKKETVRGELCNFATYLKIKGDELLCRWNILNHCVKFNDPYQRGLEDFAQGDPIFETMTKRFKEICKEPPDSYILTAREKNEYETEANIFYSNYYYAWISVYIVESILDEKYIEALHAFSFYFSLDTQYCFEYQTWPSELFRMLIFYLPTIINEKLYKKEVYEAAKIIPHLAYFTVSYTVIDEVHHEQIAQRLIASHEWVKNNIPSYYNIDIYKVFTEAIHDFETDTPHTDVNWSDYPESLKKLIEKINTFDKFSWIEGWVPEEIGSKYISARKVLTMSRLNKWVELNSRLLDTNQIIPEEKMREIEYELGIFPKES
ncbi:unnamed protein product [Blepharisma stoltei]|uniref:Ubiquitin carboxyl-terminal hydrolase n=1 Tax=Blepharisma stoltei TaxID=1481888 RepID=A0AAU9K7F7_9CILI|nr:unnamed protein product [Blepharisma stoltei]